MLHFCVCEHRADVSYQKAPVLSHLSKGHSPRSFVACRHVVWQIPVWFFYDMLFDVGCSSVDFGWNVGNRPIWDAWEPGNTGERFILKAWEPGRLDIK